MRKFLILAVLVGAAVFAAVSLANTGPGSRGQTQLPGEAKTLDAHPMTAAQGKALGVKASAKNSQFALRYLFADINVGPGQTEGGAIPCPGKNWHPVSGLFATDSARVVTAYDAPISTRKWAIFVRNEGTKTKVTVGAVCEKGLPLTAPQ